MTTNRRREKRAEDVKDKKQPERTVPGEVTDGEMKGHENEARRRWGKAEREKEKDSTSRKRKVRKKMISE